jgi:CelD/BcsL family acetyltransferase involved in cellulose biosynthesis
MAAHPSSGGIIEDVLAPGWSRPAAAPLPAPTTPVKRAAASATLRVVDVSDADALVKHAAAWQDLADHALEPNPFYEPWMLIPAVHAFGKAKDLIFVLLYRDGAAGSRLCGLFPLERRHFRRIPILGLWQHLHCFSCTPLLRAEDPTICLEGMFNWARRDPRGAALMELNHVAGEGPFHRALTDFLFERDLLTFPVESWTRAFWQARENADSYLRLALSPSGRQDFRRKRKRLGELGRLELRALDMGGAIDVWIQQFLELEASGWKGKMQTALAAAPAEREFFREIARAAFQRGRLQMLGLFLDDQPIALKCNFLAGDGAFVFKVAYDESFSRYSPGAVLELDNIDLCHRSAPAVRWMDSCAAHDHPMWNRLWFDRRPMQTLLISTGTRWGDLVVSMRPLLRWLGRITSSKTRAARS